MVVVGGGRWALLWAIGSGRDRALASNPIEDLKKRKESWGRVIFGSTVLCTINNLQVKGVKSTGARHLKHLLSRDEQGLFGDGLTWWWRHYVVLLVLKRQRLNACRRTRSLSGTLKEGSFVSKPPAIRKRHPYLIWYLKCLTTAPLI